MSVLRVNSGTGKHPLRPDETCCGRRSPHCCPRGGRAKGLRLFTSGSALDVEPVRRVGSAMAAWRAGVSLVVLVRGLTCGCSPKGEQHLRTIEILQVDTVKN